jgi:2-polyprenyl-3-methyl-5-hydroxy-6-metoxy-1,4-benzoquinol methylase
MNIGDLVRRRLPARWSFGLAYRQGRTPWDTGVTPPELVRVVEGDGAHYLPAGRALDLGCGTGTNALYLARHGWEVAAIDFAAPAIARAWARAAQAGTLPGSVHFQQGDVTQLERLHLRGPYDLVFDLGCLHTIAPAARPLYARGIAPLTAPGALLLLYAFEGGRIGSRALGLAADEVRRSFAPEWTVEHAEAGRNPDGRPATWYWLRRAG